MWSVKFSLAQLALFAAALSAFLWGNALGIERWVSLIVSGSAAGFLVVFFLYRREAMKRSEKEKNALNQMKQPWE
jgi:ABC-type thiamin/hydroxymethylpyrimidine transport system permease subunit